MIARLSIGIVGCVVLLGLLANPGDAQVSCPSDATCTAGEGSVNCNTVAVQKYCPGFPKQNGTGTIQCPVTGQSTWRCPQEIAHCWTFDCEEPEPGDDDLKCQSNNAMVIGKITTGSCGATSGTCGDTGTTVSGSILIGKGLETVPCNPE